MIFVGMYANLILVHYHVMLDIDANHLNKKIRGCYRKSIESHTIQKLIRKSKFN